eukprot:INCI3641.8.p1 GENE.INCI3641.8~~INCI3641.8.p1  ORF type:complete len:863 (-),score=102.52 INCI3641.8:1810-4155(-)
MPRGSFRNDHQTLGEMLGTKERVEQIIISRRDRRKANLLKRRKQSAAVRAGAAGLGTVPSSTATVGAAGAAGAASSSSVSTATTSSSVNFDLWDSAGTAAVSLPTAATASSNSGQPALQLDRAVDELPRPQPSEGDPQRPRFARPSSADSFFPQGRLKPGALQAHCSTIAAAKTPDQILQSLRCVRAALAADGQADSPVQIVVDSGVLSVLVRYLQRSAAAVGSHAAVTAATSDPDLNPRHASALPFGREIAKEIVWVLSLVAAGSLDHAQPLMVAMRDVYVLLVVATKGIGGANKRAESAALSVIPGAGTFSFDAELAEHCCGFIGNIAAEKTLRPALIQNSRIAKAIADAIHGGRERGNVALVSTAAWCLSNMARGQSTSANVFAEAAAIPAVIPLLAPLPADSAGATSDVLLGGKAAPPPSVEQRLLLQKEALWVVVFLTAKEPALVAGFALRDHVLETLGRLFCASTTADAQVLLLCLRALGNIVSLPPSLSPSSSSSDSSGAVAVVKACQSIHAKISRNINIWRRLHQLLSRQITLAASLRSAAPAEVRLVEDLFVELGIFLTNVAASGRGEPSLLQLFSRTGALALMCRLFGEALCTHAAERELAFALCQLAQSPDEKYIAAIVHLRSRPPQTLTHDREAEDAETSDGGVLSRFLSLLGSPQTDPQYLQACLSFVADVLERVPGGRELVVAADGIFFLEELQCVFVLFFVLRVFCTTLLAVSCRLYPGCRSAVVDCPRGRQSSSVSPVRFFARHTSMKVSAWGTGRGNGTGTPSC